MINALRGEFYCSMPPIPPPHDRVPLPDTGPREKPKVQHCILYLLVVRFHGIERYHYKVVAGLHICV